MTKKELENTSALIEVNWDCGTCAVRGDNRHNTAVCGRRSIRSGNLTATDMGLVYRDKQVKHEGRGGLKLIYTGYCIGGNLTEGGAVKE